MTSLLFADLSDISAVVGVALAFTALVAVGFVLLLSLFYRKVGPEEAMVRSGYGGLRATTGAGMWVVPVMHRVDQMDLSVKRIEIARRGEAGLICRDNIRADIEVAFFVRVNNTRDDILQVAQALGCRRASHQEALVELFDAKFSEALKTVGKRFDFVDLYNERDKFKSAILNVIGADLNGYVLDDCAIDFLEQTPLEMLNPHNILDAEGIKKIAELTAREHIRANEINREKEKTMTKQDVEAREAILALQRQQVEAEEKQKREVTEVRARETASAQKVSQEERLKSETARIATDEELQVAEQNKERTIIVAMRNKERTDVVEKERVEKDRMLEATERERIVTLAQIEKNKAVEIENRNIQEVIRERVAVERSVVEEQQRIKDTEEFAAAERRKKVALTAADAAAQQAAITTVKAAEAARQVASLASEQRVIEAEALRASAEKEAQATKSLAEAKTADQAATGLAEAQVQTAKADSLEKQGSAEASVIQKKSLAEAKGKEAMASAFEKQGSVEAAVMQAKLVSEAKGIEQKANAMKLLDGVGREHEEFKLRLAKDKEIEIAAIQAQTSIAASQAEVLGSALESAHIEILGGEMTFFDKVVGAVQAGKMVDRLVQSSDVLGDVKSAVFGGEPGAFVERLRALVEKFSPGADDLRDLSIAALVAKLIGLSDDDAMRSDLRGTLERIRQLGWADRKASVVLRDGVKS